VIIAQRPDGIRILRITRPEEAITYRASFAGAYQDIFSEAPYNERIFPSEAEGVLTAYLQTADNLTLLALSPKNKVVGFGIGLPLMSRPDIMRELRGLLPVRETFYLADLGVLSTWRGTGLGKDLVRQRLREIDRRRFRHVVLRTSAVRNASYEMYMKLGFDDMGVYMEVPSRRLDGRTSTDRRLFLSKVLPAPNEAADFALPDEPA
jgi:ribosomal protein S18 acetylase RimI-like enzyme